MTSRGFQAGLASIAMVGLVACGQPALAVARLSPLATFAAVAPATSRPVGPPNVFGTCRLPVGVPNPEGGQGTAGWLAVPSGIYWPDPASAMVGGFTWDQTVGGWVPAPPQLISPDGTSYIFGNNIIHAATRKVVHRIPYPSPPDPYTTAFILIAYTGDAIYFESTGMRPSPGLWMVKTSTWKVTQISTADGTWELVDNKAAWGINGFTDVRRLDLTTGKVTDLYRSSVNDGFLDLVGFAGSGVLVSSTEGDGSLTALRPMFVVRPDGTTAPVEVPAQVALAVIGSAFQDGPAIVFSAYYPLEAGGPPASLHGWGLAAWDPQHGLQLLVKTVPDRMGVAGRCQPL